MNFRNKFPAVIVARGDTYQLIFDRMMSLVDMTPYLIISSI